MSNGLIPPGVLLTDIDQGHNILNEDKHGNPTLGRLQRSDRWIAGGEPNEEAL